MSLSLSKQGIPATNIPLQRNVLQEYKEMRGSSPKTPLPQPKMSYYPNIRRPHHIQVWLDDMEYQRLNVLVANTGLSREQVLRDMINGLQVKEAPQMQFDEILRKLTRAGSNINQIATTLHAYGFVDEPKLDEVLEAIHHIEDMFYERFSTE